jgi:hypothetical protein
MSDTMKVSATDETLSSAGVDQTETQEVEKALNSQQIQDEIKQLSNDGDGFTEEEQMKIGGMVADKASEALQAQGKEGLSNEEKMAVAEYCSKCFDGQVDEAIAESEARFEEYQRMSQPTTSDLVSQLQMDELRQYR